MINQPQGQKEKFTIDVTRYGDFGSLSFNHDKIIISTPCWWDPKVIIASGTYLGYATYMATKGYNGIWFGNNVPYNEGTRKSNEFFIHKGNNSGWSDGCIVIPEDQMKIIWTAINPKNNPNVNILINDYDLKSFSP